MSGLELVSVPLVIGVAIPNIVGIISGGASASDSKTWYKSLRKPSFSPPDWVFGFAWTLLYSAIGFASFVVWTEGGLQKHAGAFVLYAVQLALNAAWAPAFFKAHNFSLASMLNYGMIAAASVTAWSFYKIKPVAGWLFVPYLAWLVFANYLNSVIIQLNPEGGQRSGFSSNSFVGGASNGGPSGSDLPNSPWKETATEPLYKKEGKENPGDPGYGELRGRTNACLTTPRTTNRGRPLRQAILAGHHKPAVIGRTVRTVSVQNPRPLATGASASAARAFF